MSSVVSGVQLNNVMDTLNGAVDEAVNIRGDYFPYCRIIEGDRGQRRIVDTRTNDLINLDGNKGILVFHTIREAITAVPIPEFTFGKNDAKILLHPMGMYVALTEEYNRDLIYPIINALPTNPAVTDAKKASISNVGYESDQNTLFNELYDFDEPGYHSFKFSLYRVNYDLELTVC